MSLTFDKQHHRYFLHGKNIPGVNEILQFCNLSDPRWFTPESAERGKAIHSAIEEYNNGGESNEYHGYIEQWRKFLDEWEMDVSESETREYHQLYNYAGTLDCIAWDGSNWFVIDVKTGQPQKWHALQALAYGLMLEDRKTIEGKPKLVCVYLNEDSYKARKHDYRDKEVFLGALRIWKWVHWS